MPSMQGRTILVLGGWGLVGKAICQELLKLDPKRIVVCSLFEAESDQACQELEAYKNSLIDDMGIDIQTTLVPRWGDIFAREEFKDLSKRNPTDPDYLEKVISDTFDDLNKADYTSNMLYKLLDEHSPDVVIDSVNTATGVAYQDIYKSVIDLRLACRNLEGALGSGQGVKEAAQEMVQQARMHMAGIYIPRLIRHVQVLYKGMEKVRTGHYIKIGTTGTGGMGLNIPYTHSEEKPSQVLLSKSSVAGAHSLLLYLMAKTPDMAHTMEFKPAAAIAWKKIAYEEVKRKGAPIELFDNPPHNSFALESGAGLPLVTEPGDKIKAANDTLKAVLVDTGENGVFSAGEFSAITTSGQMEYITPQEIAFQVIEELKGGNSGHDVMSSLSNTVMRSTYRAGFMRHHAVRKMEELQKKHGEDSVAFEILGPPRLSKLLYEAYLIRVLYKTPQGVLEVTPQQMCDDFMELVKNDRKLRQNIISIGIPILMPDGKNLIRGPKLAIPPYRGSWEEEISDENIDLWAQDGWVDLRLQNMENWQARMRNLAKRLERTNWDDEAADTSSAYNRKDFVVDGFLNVGEVVGWIFNVEERGARKFYDVGGFQIDS